MTESGPETALRQFIENHYGMDYQPDRLPLVTSRLNLLPARLGLRDLAEVVNQAQQGHPAILTELTAALTIGETYFLRERSQFEALRQTVLPQLSRLLGTTGNLVIWSAGCATGEEAYSLAMWTREYAPEFWPDRIRIVATDINPHFLERARQGLYSTRSFRQTEPMWQERYFQRKGNDFQIDPGLRAVVHFQEHNLSSAALPKELTAGQAALISCRNVFIYFSLPKAHQVLDLFQQAMLPDGVLMLGHAESMPRLRKWRSFYQPGTFYYQPPNGHDPEPALPKMSPSRRPARKPRPIRTVLNTPAAKFEPIAKPSPPQNRQPDFIPSAPEKNFHGSGTSLAQAQVLANQGKFDAAHEMVQAVSEQDRTSVDAHFLGGVIATQLRNWPDAQQALRKALYLDKKLALGHYLLAVVHERSGDPAAAIRGYRNVCKLLARIQSSHELYLGDGMTAGRLREMAEARQQELSTSL